MAEQPSEPMRFKAWANDKGYDTSHTYDTERSRWVFFNPMTADLWESWRAALSQPSTEQGWKLVPIEPQSAMLDRAVSFALNVKLSSDYRWTDYMKDLWATMLAGSPPPPIEPREEKL